MHLKTGMILLVSLLAAGCALTGLESSFKADRYFSMADYQGGIETFREKVEANPDKALDNYYLGRFYLAEGMHRQALSSLQRAASLDLDDIDSQFWLGVAYGAGGDGSRADITGNDFGSMQGMGVSSEEMEAATARDMMSGGVKGHGTDVNSRLDHQSGSMLGGAGGLDNGMPAGHGTSGGEGGMGGSDGGMGGSGGGRM